MILVGNVTVVDMSMTVLVMYMIALGVYMMVRIGSVIMLAGPTGAVESDKAGGFRAAEARGSLEFAVAKGCSAAGTV